MRAQGWRRRVGARNDGRDFAMSDKPKRVAGYDFARSLAIFSMVVVNYSLVMGATQAGPDRLA